MESTNTDIQNISCQLEQLNKIIEKKVEIEENFETLKSLKIQEDILSTKLMKFSELEKNIHATQNEINSKRHQLELELQKLDEKVLNLKKEKAEQEKIIKDKTKIIESFDKLAKAREEESEYQKKSNLAQKLSEKKHQLEKKLQEEIHNLKISESRIKAKISDRQKQIISVPELNKKNEELEKKIEELDKLVVYRDSIKEKGTKLSSDIEHNKKSIGDKTEETKVYESKVKQWSEIHEANCPMCNTYLDENDKKKIVEKYRQDIQAIEIEIEQLQVDNQRIEKQIDEFREIYKKVTTDLKNRDIIQKQLGEVEQLLANADEAKKEIKLFETELKNITEKLESNQVNSDLLKDLAETTEHLSQLEFNPEKLAILQAKVNDWKWAELRHSQLEQAETKFSELEELLPNIENKKNNLAGSLESNLFAREKETELKVLQKEQSELDYKKEEHQNLKQRFNSLREYENHWNNLQQAVTKSFTISQEVERLNITKSRLEKEIYEEHAQIEKIPELEKELFEKVKQLDEASEEYNKLRKDENLFRTELIKSMEKLEHIEKVKIDISSSELKGEKFDYEGKLYKELVNAFGKNGIQAVIIENAIPEIEHAANSLLNRMTEGRMNITFNTRKTNKSNEKVSETLDIFISDELGTRNYEMYSGGEAFRVNFAIRLALSKILARRAGTKLKTLVIDEGFGTQDAKGISRLIEAINTVSNDFEKILIITHMNELKEAFPAKIEVFKSIHGSEIRVYV